MLESETKIEFTQRFSVDVQAIVKNSDGSIITEHPVEHNMITDIGLDYIYRHFGELEAVFRYAHIGTGTTPTNRRTLGNKISVTGNIVTSSGPLFSSSDVGRVIQFPNNRSSYIQSIISETSVQLRDSLPSLSSVDCIIWDTKQKNLDQFYKTSGTWVTGECGTINTHVNQLDTGYLDQVMWRTIRFTFTEDRTITEAGWGATDKLSTSTYDYDKLFGRIVFKNPIQMQNGQILDIKVSMRRRFPGGTVSADPFVGQPATYGGDYLTLSGRVCPYRYINSDGKNQGSYVYVISWFEPQSTWTDEYVRFNTSSGNFNYTVRWPNQVTGQRYAETNLITTGYIAGTTLNYVQFYGDYDYVSNAFRITYTPAYVVPHGLWIKFKLRVSWDRQLPDFGE